VKALSGRPKKCKECGTRFVPSRVFQVWCTPDCAVKIARKIRAKEKTVELKQRREAIKTRTEWLKDVQTAFNAWIRERDYGKPCISCGATTGQMQAGHYRSVGACPALRFNELNTNAQCVHCNLHNSGNQIEYRRSLVKQIGPNRVEWLEQDHQPNKYTIDELKEMKRRYARMARELKRARA
jgi:hypothetical protein